METTILVVEDETAIRELLGQGLRRRGYEVLTAADGDEALRMCAKHTKPIEVLLCDDAGAKSEGPDSHCS